MTHKINFRPFFWKIRCYGWFNSFWVHVFFPFLSLFIRFQNFSQVSHIRTFRKFKISVLFVRQIADFSRIIPIEMKLVQMETKPFIHNYKRLLRLLIFKKIIWKLDDYLIGLSFFLFQRAMSDTPATLTTLNLTPEKSPLV